MSEDFINMETVSQHPLPLTGSLTGQPAPTFRARLIPMAHRAARLATAAFVLGAVFAGCGSSPPPEPEIVDEPISKPKPEPKAEPAPPCSTLADRCGADDDTRAPVPGTDLVFAPPSGWLFAAEPDVTLAQTPDGGPCLAIATFEVSGDVEANREAAIGLLLRSVGVDLPSDASEANLVSWDTPDQSQEIGEITLDLWQKDGGSRASRSGPMLLFQFDVGEERTAVGLGFVPTDDGTEADAKIMQSLETVGKGEVVTPEVGDEEGGG